MASWRERIRLTKNDWLQGYFRYRIESVPNPYQVAFRSKPYRVLFVLSHMRSGSSLLTHILNANPDVIGYGESHITYDAEAHLKTLLFKVYSRVIELRRPQDLPNLRMQQQYVMDKLLHDNKLPDESLLQQDQVYSLFLLREPQRSLASILDLKPHWTEETAIEYYVSRLNTLEHYAQRIDNPNRAMLLTYEQLLNETKLALETLQTFLQTADEFSENYSVLRTTGLKGVGDPKGNIKAGQIVRQQRQLTVQVSPAIQEQAQTAYEHCFATLSQYCTACHPLPLVEASVSGNSGS